MSESSHTKEIQRRGGLIWALVYSRHLFESCPEPGRSDPKSVKEAWDYADLAEEDFIDESIRQDRVTGRSRRIQT